MDAAINFAGFVGGMFAHVAWGDLAGCAWAQRIVQRDRGGSNMWL